MVSLRLESATDTIDLAEVENDEYGGQSLTGLTGMGLPPVDVTWAEGAGNGARFRSMRVLPRDMDIPIYMRGRDRDELKQLVSRLAVMFSDECRLVFVDERDDEWSTNVVRTGGGDWTYGLDTIGEDDVLTVVTVRAGDPFFTSSNVSTATVTASGSRGLLTGGSLVALQLSSSQAIGQISLVNDGDADAYPVWVVNGPATKLTFRRADGRAFIWDSHLATGDTLTFDTQRGTVIDSQGNNRYDGFTTRPRFWAVPRGTTTATVELTDPTPGVSQIVATWRARRWVNI